MAENLDDVLPTAQQVRAQLALQAAEKAEEDAQRRAGTAAGQQELIDELSRPSGLSEDAKVKLAATVIERAVRNGLKEIQVYKFPNIMCTDRGRAINQQEDGWENTLTGIPKEIYQLWHDHLRPRGYQIRYIVVDFPDGLPGDIGVILSW